jgi:hypothetical protein
MQTALPVVLAVTYPAGLTTPSGVAGLLDVSNRWSALVPIATMFVTALANMAVIGPATTKCMRDRKSQGEFPPFCLYSNVSVADVVAERKDGKKSYDPPPHSQEMVALNKKFGKLHGISSLLNMATFVASIVYGVSLSRRIV